jgi:hypothetical protein
LKFNILIFGLLIFHTSYSQRFFGSTVFGINISQIDGDLSAGYKRIGLTGGFKVDYPIKEYLDLSAELLYSSRGSRHKKNDINIDLNYIEIPFLLSVRDWYIEKDKYDKVKADIGFSYSYLFNGNTSKNVLEISPENFKKHDFSFLIGGGYMFNKHVGLYARYTRDFFKLYETELLPYGGFLSYFITIRSEYHF